jgi:3-deoxy-D-manno-octulosonic-acid transferase
VKASLARLIYGALLWLATPLYFARLAWRGRREPLYRQHWAERLGWGGQPEPGRLWLHAVSLGETRAAEPLVQALRAQAPGLRLLLTHGTATGREAGQALLREGDAQVWLPYDTPGATRRFLARHRPAVGVVMETEVWPALLHAAKMAGVPMVLANARLSERSLRKARRLPALMRPAAAAFTQVLAQTEGDAQRLREAGAGAVQVAGNLKFDTTPDPAQLARGAAWRALLHDSGPATSPGQPAPGDALSGPTLRPVVLMASSREGEEAPLLAAWVAALAQRSALRPLLLLVPRHPQRFDEVAALVHNSGLRLLRRSSWADRPPPQAAQADVWLGDSVGEMALYYAVADAALLGGSFAPLGGHNLIEAAACGCPIVLGPHTFNFAQAADQALAAGAAWRAADMAAGVQQALALATDPARQRQVLAARAFAAEHRGAAARMAAQVLGCLAEPQPRDNTSRTSPGRPS